MSAASPAGATTRLVFDAPIGCPLCRRELSANGERVVCPPCGRGDCPESFAMTAGFPDLVVGQRFDDDVGAALLETEARNTRHTVGRFWTPLFRQHARPGERLRVLAVGCGAGLEVDLLRADAFDCVGIDNGNRAAVWSERQSRHALAMANAMHLPFPDGYFDIAFCGCVFPHVGVVGDSARVTAQCRHDRLAVAREMVRVVRPGGQIMVSSPNRWFPLDLFHGRAVGSYRTPLNPPWRKFLLSAGDYRRLFMEAGSAGPARAISIRDYWGFCRTGQTTKGRLIALPVRALLYLGASAATAWLRTSALVPWIVVKVRR